MINAFLAFGLVAVAQEEPRRVAPAPILRHGNPAAASGNRRTDQSVICRQRDEIKVSIRDGRITELSVSGHDDLSQLEMVQTAITNENVSHVKIECRTYSAMMTPFDEGGNRLGVLTLRYK